ncbi:DUF87 domain-containing protein [Glycomyces sp. NPDC047369]
MSDVLNGSMFASIGTVLRQIAAALWASPQVRLILIVAAVAAAAWVVVQVARRILHARDRARWQSSARYVEIAAPQVVDESGGEVFWKQLGFLARPAWRRYWLGQPHLVWEMRVTGRRLTMRVWVPGCVNTASVLGAVEAAWPGAGTRIVDAEPPLKPQGLTAGGRLGWARFEPHPVLVEQGIDPLRALCHLVDEVDSDVELVVQVAASPVGRRQMSRIAKGAWSSGRDDVVTSSLKGFMNLGLSVVTLDAERKAGPTAPAPESEWIQHQRRIMQERLKGGSAWWSASVRWAVSVPSGGRARLRREAEHLGSAVRALPGGVVRRKRLHRPERLINGWSPGSAVLVNTAEIATLAHLPFDAIVPSLERARARRVRPPEQVPRGGRRVKPLGRAAQGGRKVGLAAADGRQHLHVLGATGTGKSTLLQNMILSDIRSGIGVMVIDPKGDLVNDLLDRLDPATVADRLVLIDAAEPAGHGFFPLSGPNREIAIDHVVGICNRLWSQHWGPRADYILRNGLRTVLTCGYDLVDLPQVLMNPSQWKHVKERIGDDETLNVFWDWWADKMDTHTRQQAIGPILSRFDMLFGNEFMRATIGRPTKPVDIGKVLDGGGTVLARLPKGELPDTAVPLLGSILVGKAWQCGLQRSALPDEKRPETVLYIDECHNFLNLPHAFEDVLTEARGMHMGLVLAHQHLGQLDQKLADAISANARNKVLFNSSPEDAHRLARHTLPELGEDDLSHLDGFEAACRLIVNGVPTPAFTLRTEGPAPVVGAANLIRDAVFGRSPRPRPAAAPTMWQEAQQLAKRRAAEIQARQRRSPEDEQAEQEWGDAA